MLLIKKKQFAEVATVTANPHVYFTETYTFINNKLEIIYYYTLAASDRT